MWHLYFSMQKVQLYTPISRFLLLRYERENKKLQSDVLRLDTENDNLARQLLNDKIEMRK